MALTALTAFIIAGVMTVFTAFLMFVTWPRRQENGYKQIKLFTGSVALTIVTLGAFLIVSDPSANTIVANDSYDVPDNVETVEEEAGWHITVELGQVTSSHHDVIQNMTYHEGATDEDAVLEAELMTEDNITTDLIRTSTLNRSAHVLQRLSDIDEVDQIHLVWDIYFEPESGPGEIDQIIDMKIDQDKLQTVEWNHFEGEDLDEIAMEYWEKPDLNPVHE